MIAGFTMDAGALIALERAGQRTRTLLRGILDRRLPMHVPAGALAQVWRGGGRQARLARFLDLVEVQVAPLDAWSARAVGELCARTGHDDVVGVHVALHARLNGHAVVTSDPDDIARVDPTLQVVVV